MRRGWEGSPWGPAAWDTARSEVRALPVGTLTFPRRSSSSSREIKIRFQLCLKLFPAAVVAPSIPTIPKPPLMARCPYHTQQQCECLACHVMTHFGAKRRRASPGSHIQAKAPFFHLCCAEAQPCKTPGCGTCSTAGLACKEPSALWRRGFPWQGFFSPARPGPDPGIGWLGRGCYHTTKGKAPSSRCLLRGRMTWDRKHKEKGREAAGRGNRWGSATTTAALTAQGSWLCNAPRSCKPEQLNSCLLAFWWGTGAVSVYYWKYSLLCCSEALTDLLSSLSSLNADTSAFLALKKNLHLTCVL